MALYIDVRVNDRVVASAAVQNIAGPDDGPCDYRGDAWTSAFGNARREERELFIYSHDRRQSVWALVQKIAAKLVEPKRLG